MPGASGYGGLPGQLAYEGASYLRPHSDWEVLNSKPTLNHVANVKIVDTDASGDVNTYRPGNVTPTSTPMTALVWLCVNSPRWSTVKIEIVNRKKDSRAVDTTLSESTPPTIDPNVSMKNPPEYLTPVSTPMTALAWPCVNSPRLPTVKPEIVNRMMDSCEVNRTQPESAPPPTKDPNVSMKNPPEYLTPVSTPMTALAWPCVNLPRLPTVKPRLSTEGRTVVK